MNMKLLLAIVLLVSVFVLGCQPQQNYAAYNQQGGQAQGGQYVGGGCGVLPDAPYKDTPVESIKSDSAL
jgi:hypothetical protein